MPASWQIDKLSILFRETLYGSSESFVVKMDEQLSVKVVPTFIIDKTHLYQIVNKIVLFYRYCVLFPGRLAILMVGLFYLAIGNHFKSD